MDPALLEEREDFKKKPLSNPLIETKQKKAIFEPLKKESETASTPKPSNDYKTCSASFQYDLQILSRIIKYMRERSMNGQNYSLSLEEILDETKQFFVSKRQRNWLMNEALVNNPKIQINGEGRYLFKPTYDIKDKKELMKQLQERDLKGHGGIFFDDVRESLPYAEKALKGDNIVLITQPKSKKKVLFYNDKALQFNVDENFQKLWKSVAVENVDDDKIETYLQKFGIKALENASSIPKVTPIPKRKVSSKRNRSFKRLNEHMGGILQDYSDKQ